MFVALDTRTNVKIISLDPRRGEHDLREDSRAGVLVCPECRQMVTFRVGNADQLRPRRRHFAHRVLSNCSLEHERPELTEARAVLYEWLVAKFDEVEIEHRPEHGARLPRPIDVLVREHLDRDNPFLHEVREAAFWVFDAPMRQLEARAAIAGYFADALKTPVTWIFSSKMLTGAPGRPNAILLTKMERDFAVRTQYDEPQPNSLGSLHYLDAHARHLITYRRLRLVHGPNIYAGDVCTTALSALLVDPRSFEIAYPGEYELLQRSLAQRELALADERMRVGTVLNRFGADAILDSCTRHAERQPRARCQDCDETKPEGEFVIHHRKTNEGVCRSCMRRRTV
jgi:hypothetical protein